jgi:hypothetical protein
MRSGCAVQDVAATPSRCRRSDIVGINRQIDCKGPIAIAGQIWSSWQPQNRPAADSFGSMRFYLFISVQVKRKLKGI